MSLVHHVLGDTDEGRERGHNEDAYAFVPREGGGWLLVVCDGMGGHEAGEVASAVALERLKSDLGGGALERPESALNEALLNANEAVLDASDNTGHSTMGTTAVVGLVKDDALWFGWVGDSRLYLFRKGELLRRSKDHTHVQRMVDAGVLTEEEARNHPDANVLVQALGGGRGSQLDLTPSVEGPVPLEQGDVVLLCSDGLYDLIEDFEIYPLIEGLTVESAVRKLIDEANARGGHDNITVLLLIAGQDRVDMMPEGVKRPAPPPAPPPPGAPAAESSALVWQVRALRYALPLLAGLGAGVAVSYWLRSRG